MHAGAAVCTASMPLGSSFAPGSVHGSVSACTTMAVQPGVLVADSSSYPHGYGMPQDVVMGMAHPVGGGRGAGGTSAKNCIHPGCTKGAIGKLRLCIAHGGGKRCTVQGCNKAAQGQKPLCKAHGGGRRCKHPGCPRSARDRTDLCIGHGGGKRCLYSGCVTSARSGTLYCSLHDGVVKKHVPGVPGPSYDANYGGVPHAMASSSEYPPAPYQG